MRQYTIYTDGSVMKNPNGPGAGAALMVNAATSERRVFLCFEKKASSNRMEMLALIKPLERLSECSTIEAWTDSEYLARNYTEKLRTWQFRRWKLHTGQEVANRDLWQRLYDLSLKHLLTIRWLRGHQGHTENEFVDTLAREALRNPSKYQELKSFHGTKVVHL